MRTALFLCNKTPNAYLPWLELGYECITVDMALPPGEHHRDGNLIAVGADVLTWMPPIRDYVFACAFPPCTNLAVSGARWFRDKGLKSLAESLLVVDRCREILEWSGAPYYLENPVSTIATYWRKPDYSFNPCDYAGYLTTPEDEAYTKKTCLWTGGGFVMPEPCPVNPTLGSKMHLLPPSEDRAALRSVTPAGFAKAVAQANAPLLAVDA